MSLIFGVVRYGYSISPEINHHRFGFLAVQYDDPVVDIVDDPAALW